MRQGLGNGSSGIPETYDTVGYDRIQLYTNEAMTENLDCYPRKGYVETHRSEQDGYRRVFFTKTLNSRSG